MQKSLISILFLTFVLGCTHAKPRVICTLENPTTHERVVLFKEIPYKNASDYDEAKHSASWKAEQATKGFTREVK